jgi:hypothetical protein
MVIGRIAALDIYNQYKRKEDFTEHVAESSANKLTTSGHKPNHFVTKMTSTGQT